MSDPKPPIQLPPKGFKDDLPGPAEWWREHSFDYDEHNWDADTDARIPRRAFMVIRQEFDFTFVRDVLHIAPNGSQEENPDYIVSC